MRVQSIGNQCNHISFGDIYKSKECDYTQKQNEVIDNIIGKLTEPSPKFNGSTAETFYKSQGIDFGIECYDHTGDTIWLEGRKGVKTVGTGVEEAITWGDSFKIGIYDDEHPFKTDDIETAIKDNSLKSSVFILPAIAVIIGFLGIIGLGIAKCSSNTQKQGKALIENVDTIVNNPVIK